MRTGRRGVGRAVAVGVAAALALARCGGSAAPPATGAASVVPARALAFVNVSLDHSRPEVGQAERLARRFAGVSALIADVQDRLAQISGVSGPFAAAVRPWVGGEAAVALLRGSGNRARALVVLSVRDRRAFRRFLSASAGGGVGSAGGYAVFGDAPSIALARQVARGAAPALAGDPVYRRADDGAPDDRVVDVYAPTAGLESILAGRGGVLGGLGALLDSPGLRGVSAALSPASRGARVWIHSVFGHGAAPAVVSGTPTLQSEVPAGAALLLDVPDLARAAPRLLIAGGVAGIGGQVGPLLTRLGAALRAEGVAVRTVVRLFSHEGAVAITSVAGGGGRPGLLVLARTPKPGYARVRLAALEPPLASLFPPASSGPGTAPVFATRSVAGVPVHSLQLAPGLQFDYAVFGHLIALATGVGPIASVVARQRSLGESAGFRAVLGDSSPSGTSLVFANLNELIRLGEQTGLLSGAASGALAADLTRIAAIGLRSQGGGDESTAELHLSIP